jgi:PAS domain S-box-containing protein
MSSSFPGSPEQELLALRQRVAELEAVYQLPTCQGVRLATIAATMPGVIFQFCIRNGTWMVDYISDRIDELCGVSAPEVMQDLNILIDRIHPDELDRYLASVCEAVECMTPWCYEGRIIKPNGEIRWVRGESIPTQIQDLEIVFCGVIMDITEQKKLEHNLRHARDQLATKVALQTLQIQQQYQLLQSILDNTNVSIFVKECRKTNGTYILINREFAKRFNLDVDRDLGKTDSDFFSPTVAEAFRQADLQVLEQGTPIKIQEIEPDGDRERTSIVVKFPLFDQQGDAYAIGGIATDITELKQAEQALQQTNVDLEHRVAERTLELQKTVTALQTSETELRQKNQDLQTALETLHQTQFRLIQSEKMSSLGQLVAGIAHEINNPVNFIHGNVKHAHQYIEDLLELLSLYQTNYPTPIAEIQTAINEIDLEFLKRDVPKVLDSMRTGTQRIRAIVQSLRTFSRMDEAEFKTVNLHDGIDSTLTVLQHRLNAKCTIVDGQECVRPEIQVIKHYGNLPEIDCYAGQLNQVFLYLLNNAIDALEYCLTPAIHIQTNVDRDRLLIQIRDNGAGMSEPIRQRMFDPFFTTKSVGQGTGMGLSISYQVIVEQHGGTLDCQSYPDEGTEFTISLPL